MEKDGMEKDILKIKTKLILKFKKEMEM